MDLIADFHQSFHFRGNEQLTVLIVTVVQRNDANGITRHHPEILVLVIETEGIHATEFFEEVRTVLQVERQHHLAIRFGAK
jgi:hypothetical protein